MGCYRLEFVFFAGKPNQRDEDYYGDQADEYGDYSYDEVTFYAKDHLLEKALVDFDNDERSKKLIFPGCTR